MNNLTEQLQNSLGHSYVLDREVGRGGMATVYLARDVKHDRRVALKVLDPELGAVLGADRFLSEIRVTANLQHPNLLPLFDSGEAGGLLYYVMPYVEGESLRHRIEREKQLPVDEAVRIAVAIANALDYAHGHGIIHRDLKPENILLQHGQPVVADFGIALAVSNAGGARVTQTGLSLGTPQYMSPEQATGDRTIDARTDIYSLAAMTYEMLAGEPPHTGTSAQAIIAKLMTTEPQPVRTLRPSVPANVAMAVEQGLAKLPADRFGSAKVFSDALTNASFTTSLRSVTAAPSRSRRGVELTLGAVAAASLVAAGWMWTHRAPAHRVERYSIELDSTEAIVPGGRWGRIAISPDGSTIIYVGGPRNGLMVRRRDELHAKPIPGAEAAGAPFFSPDGTHVGFIQNASKLMIVGLDGAPPVFVTDSLVGLAGLYWAPDGMIYADGQGPTPLIRVPARSGGKPERLIAFDTAAGERDQIFPSVLPDGKGILFTGQIRPGDGSPIHQAIKITDRVTGAHYLVVDDARFARYVSPGYLIYLTTGGMLMAAPFDLGTRKITGSAVVLADDLSRDMNSTDVALSESGTLLYLSNAVGASQRELVWVGRDGREQPVDSAWHGTFTDPAISPDGTRIAVSTGVTVVEVPGTSVTAGTGTGDVWMRRLDNGVVTKLTVEGGDNRFPAWAWDGKSVFYAGGTNRTSIVERRADGSAPPATVVQTDEYIGSIAPSPDRQWLVYQSGAGAANSHLFVRRAGDTVSTPLFPGKSITRSPALSPDGKWLAYVSNETGTSEVFVVPFPNVTSAKWQVSRQGGTDPLWSTRGDEVIYRAGDRYLVSVPVSTRPTFSPGTPKRLFSAASYLPHIVIAHDDSRFLMVRPLGGASRERLTVFENWASTLVRK